MAAEHQYFYEDEVYRINKKGNIEFGMVLENSELVSSDENSDNEEGHRMKKGHIRVAWHPTGIEEVIQEKKVGLADRSLMPGDVVRRLIKGKDTQRGYCRDIHVSACVQVVGTKQVITDINSKDLVPVEDFMPDVAVCLDSWVGTIKTVRSKLHLAFADGSKCIISDVEACVFEELDERRSTDCEFPHRNDYHPGQVLYGPVGALDEAVWISCSKGIKALKAKPQKSIKVVVEAVETDSVTVHWQCRAYSPDGSCDLREQPHYVVQGETLKKLKLLNVFDPCTLQIGDRLYYTVTEADNIMSKDQWRIQQKEYMLEKSPNRLKFLTKNKGIKGHQENKSSNEKKESCLSPFPTNVEEKSDPREKSPEKSPTPQLKVTESGGANEDWETDEGGASQDDTASVSSGCSSNSSSAGGGGGTFGRKKKSPALMTKVLKFKKLRRSRRKTPNLVLKPNIRAVVETLSTSSTADVVWQDGSVELDIPSTQLFPIHHLDDQEFFPGDFVMENKEDGCLRVYGVVQSVDHAGRMAVVNWFHTYTSSEDPNPTQLDPSEVSVYDLKDHPDFQYRPGTVAIRVANFDGEDATCTAGQVLDNYPEGRVHVWWVDGHVSMCWPQDLYKVGDYDSDEGELWDDGSSEGSWETESEGSVVVEEDVFYQGIKPKLAANIEKARIAMSRLEELFTQNPALQTLDIMKKLLEVYKDCRYLDKLMGTCFFHENNFQGLLERVRERGRASVGSKVAEQVSRLFLNSNDETNSKSGRIKDGEKKSSAHDSEGGNTKESLEKNKILINNEVNSEKIRNCFDYNGDVTENLDRVNKTIDNLSVTLDEKMLERKINEHLAVTDGESMRPKSSLCAARITDEKSEGSLKSGNSEDEFSNGTEKSPGSMNGQLLQSSSADDSGVFERSSLSGDVASLNDNCDCLTKTTNRLPGLSDGVQSEEKVATESKRGTYIFGAMGSRHVHGQTDKKYGSNKGKHASQTSFPSHVAEKETGSEANRNDPNASQVCAKLCALIKCQLVKAHAEVTRRFQNDNKTPVTLSEVERKDSHDRKSKEKEKESEEKEETTEEKLAEDSQENSKEGNGEGFSVMSNAPNSHKFKLTMCQMSNPSLFYKTIKKELTLLKTSLPPGIWVKGFEDRTDLYSVMIRGPEKTPYEDGLFVFDFQLPSDYPRTPPLCHYLSYCSDRLNPNLYEDGKVCVSLLGTWGGKGTEVWTLNSNLLQVIVSIQGLILVNEPYFNEANYEKQKGSQQGHENSRMYNEMAILKLVQAMTKMVVHPPQVFKEEIKQHFAQNADRFVSRLEKWLDISEKYIEDESFNKEQQRFESETSDSSHSSRSQNSGRNIHWEKSLINLESTADQPEFPLLPASKGFCLTLRKSLAAFRNVLESQTS